MAQLARHVIAEELSQLRRTMSDESLNALQVAVYLEDALDIVLPEQYLSVQHLGSPAAIERTLDTLLGSS